MANHHGNEGVVKVGSDTVAEVTEWSIEESAAVADDSSMGDTWETHKAGLNKWQGSLNCHWDETDTTGQGVLTIGASVTLNLYPEGNASADKYYTGTATVTGIQRQGNMNGIVSANFTFQGNGALSLSTVV